MNPIISLIAPAYNVEKYIEACVHSCENQDLPRDSYEIIIVNDGSTDKTLEIAQKYYEKNPTSITIINKKYAAIAQLVEQGTENPCVLGSIPSCGIFF